MFQFRYLLWGAPLCALSLALFFVGRERASWRPQWVSKGGIKIVEARASRDLARSQLQTRTAKQRFAKRKFDVWSVSADGKWMACDYRKLSSYNDCIVDVRNAQSGELKRALNFNNVVNDRPESFTFSPGGNYLIVNFGYDGFQSIFDLRTGQRTWINMVDQVLFPPDEKMVICVRLVPRRHGEQSAYIWTSHVQTKRVIRKIPVPTKSIPLPVWMDGPDHIVFGDTNDNLWRVRVR